MSKPCGKYISFALILYPENEQHQRILSMFERREPLYKAVYILHDRDIWTDGDDLPEGVNIGDRKKPHWHVAITRTQQTTPEAFSKFLGGIHVEGLHDRASYQQYMLHDTPSSWHKVQYSPDEMHGYRPEIKKMISKNGYFVQLQEIAKDISRGESLLDIVMDVNDNESALFTDVYKTYGGLITAMANQYDRRSTVKAPRCKLERELRDIKDSAMDDNHYYTAEEIHYMRQIVNEYERNCGL